MINLGLGLHDSVGENCYEATFKEHRWSLKGTLGEEHEEL